VIPARVAELLDEVRPMATRFSDAGHEIYLVGGCVRDAISNQPLTGDLDFTTDARPDVIKTLLRPMADALWDQGERFGTIGAKFGDRTVEVTTFRAESYNSDSRKPEVSFGDSLEVDLSRRDFTINAMALRLPDAQLVDPFDGAVDLVAKRLRTPLDPEISFSDDPLRMLRAARFLTRFELVPDSALVDAVKTMAERLSIVSAERIRDEFDKLVTLDHPSAGLWFLCDTGLAAQFLPELPAMRVEQDPIHRHKDVLTHTLAVMENVRPQMHVDFDFRIVRLAALFHDIAKPKTRSIKQGKGVTFHHHDVVGGRMTRDRMQALKYSNDDVAAVVELVNLHLRFHTYKMGWTDAAVRRYVRDAGPLLRELNVLTRCDCTTRNERKARELARRMDDLEVRIDELNEAEELSKLRPEMDGQAVMAHLDVPPGRVIGEALAYLMNIRLDEGLLGDDAIRARLDAWWTERSTAS
jgi:poly(A) polymerase